MLLNQNPQNCPEVSAHAEEFQTIILAGLGNGLSPLVDGSTVCKSLLPIANRPMIEFPLEWCENAGLTDVTIVCHQENAAKLSAYISSEYTGNARVDIKAPSSFEENLGTADVLRRLKPQIKHSAVILSCDFCTDAEGYRFLDFYRLHDPSVMAMAYSISEIEKETTNKKSISSQFLGIDKRTNQLLFSESEVDAEDGIRINMRMLWNHPKMSFSSNLHDAHLYVMKKWVIDFVVSNEKISSLKDDLVPLLAKLQYMPKKASLLLKDYLPKPQENSESEELKVLAFIDQNCEYCVRTNNVPYYFGLNRMMIRRQTVPAGITKDLISSKAIIGNDCIIGDMTQVDDRSNIKKSIIGRSCKIMKGVSITNSVVMDRVQIEDYARIDGCIISNDVIIQAKAKLSNCNVAVGYTVDSETVAKNEDLMEMEELDF